MCVCVFPHSLFFLPSFLIFFFSWGHRENELRDDTTSTTTTTNWYNYQLPARPKMRKIALILHSL
jgi:hypothetical protein